MAIKRDRWERPVLPNPETKKEEPYTRASTLSGAIDNTYDLEVWKRRQTAIGLAKRPDLIASVQTKNDDKKALDNIVQVAMEIAGSTTSANLGIAIHSFCEMLDKREPIPTGVDWRITASLKVYENAMEPFKIKGIELFVAAPEVMSAGTFDRLIQNEEGLFIADIKTGQNAPQYAHATAVQMAVYAHGRRFSETTGWGVSLPNLGVNQEKGILIHLPALGDPVCHLYWIDLIEGWKMARIAYRVRKWWRQNPCSVIE